jgi:HAD superfamily hydrolase (TIGR01509 family)
LDVRFVNFIKEFSLAIIEAVLWDMDGILLDSERLVHDIFVEVMADANLNCDLSEMYLGTVGMNQKSILELYVNHLGTEQQALHYFKLIETAYRERIKTDLVLKPGVVDALEAVKAADIQQMVVTSTKTESAHNKIGMFDLQDYFCDLVGGDQVTNGKPNPEPYLLACEKLGVEPSRALVIEDSPNGVRAGINAGSMVIHIPDLIETNPEWNDEIYDALDSLVSFPSWLTAQRGGDWV